MMKGSTVVSKTTDLYRHFTEDGELLYIGISTHTMFRLSQGHQGSAPWYDDIRIITIQKFQAREAALAAEKAAIIEEKPLHNKAWNPDLDYPKRRIKSILKFTKPTANLNKVPEHPVRMPAIWDETDVQIYTSLHRQDLELWKLIFPFPKRVLGKNWHKNHVIAWTKTARQKFQRYLDEYEELFNDPRDH